VAAFLPVPFRPYAHKDFAFKTPSQDLRTTESSLLKLQRASAFEIYDYPGGYTQKGDGQQLTRLRMEEHEAAYHTVAGVSICASFFAGGKFTMTRHHLQAEEKQEYVLQRLAHRASDYTYITANAGPPSYDNSFEAFPAATQFRPAGRTPWPTVHGPQTATVVGPPGEIIHTDKHGRVKLHFHWDRRGKRNDKDSCWVRVSQNWAGKGWGGVFIPHVGQEVVVSYQEGDPDMPLVTGRVYNGENSKAIDLPANKTQSAIQDHSGNSILMEGKGGVQDIRVHAVKDMHEKVDHDHDSTIINDETTQIGGNRTETVTKNESVTIGLARTHHIGMMDTLTVGAARVHTVVGGEAVTIGAARSVAVGGSQKVQIGASQSIGVGKSQTISVGADESLTVGGSEAIKVGKDRFAKIDENDGLDVGKTFSITAGDQIVLKTGSATITMSKNGDISIEGKTITIKGSGDVIIKGQKISQN
jgi:type VI secretion system secreted protein VgrG